TGRRWQRRRNSGRRRGGHDASPAPAALRPAPPGEIATGAGDGAAAPQDWHSPGEGHQSPAAAMSEPRIAELHFRPKRGSPWALLRVGMTESEARAALGRVDRELKARAHSGQIVFRPPLPLPER